MFDTLPADAMVFATWPWTQIKPYYDDLAARPLSAESVTQWLTDWSDMVSLFWEVYARLMVATTLDTADEAAQTRFHKFLEEVVQPQEAADHVLRQKLLDSGLTPAGMEVAVRNLRIIAKLFREENIPLSTEEEKLGNEYSRTIGTQNVEWEGREIPIPQILPVYQSHDRAERERAWRLVSARQLQDREAINALWQKLLAVRQKQAQNAGFERYIDFRWQQLLRVDYTQADCLQFHDSIEQEIVPAVQRIYERRRKAVGYETLRPWDFTGAQGSANPVKPATHAPLKPFENETELVSKGLSIFQHVDPQLGAYFANMMQAGLLDLTNRKGKAPGGYCITYAKVKQPFIFMNAVGLHDDVQTLLHEAGHAFHAYEASKLPYMHQRSVGSEFSEVASMSMELLASPYLTHEHGGYYTRVEAARAVADHLETMLIFWPYMAVVDAFQHWVYTHENDAADPAACDAQWTQLWRRFQPGVDWSGLEDAEATGWHRKLHIHIHPFYYVEYGLAQLGAVQLWRNALSDQAGAVAGYRRGLALGGTRPLPELFAAAGARFAFDSATLRMAVELLEGKLEELEQIQAAG